MARLRFLHLHSSFDAGGKELRAVRLMGAFGKAVEHVIVSAVPEAMGAAAAVGKGVAVSYPADFPALSGKPLPGRLQRLALAMRGFDLVLTYNWGAMDAALAHTLFGEFHRLPPLVHHEDGFNQDEATKLKPWRNWYRRIALARAAAVLVPSRRLEDIALTAWQQPRGRSTASPMASTRPPMRASRVPMPCPGSSSGRASCGLARLPACARSRTCRAWSAPLPACRSRGSW